MSPARLLEHFDRLVDTPDAVPRLRRFILDLAVRGKLVEQDPKDEPARELLRRIETEKARLVKAGEIRKPKPLPPIDEDSTPFELPPRWEWAPIRQITTDRGQKIPDDEFTYIDVSAINKERGEIADPQVLTPDVAPSRARKIVEKGDIIYSCVRPYLLNIAVVEEAFNPGPIVSTAFAVLNGHGLVQPRYLWIVLRSPFFVECVEGKMRGQAYPAINDADFAPLPVPVPPLAEQHRIVAKVDELMALCDELEAAQTKREKRRDRLVAATLHGLNNGAATPTPGAPATFEESAHFYFNHLPRLTTRPEHIHQLRQTILNLAVRGKLVPQDQRDQPASELIDEIKKEKRTLIGQGSVRKGRPPKELGDPALFFDLPKGWSWVRLGELAKMVTSGSRDWAQHYSEQGAIFVRMGNLSRGSYHLRLNHIQRVKPPDDTEGARTKLEEGDLLVSITGETGLLGLIPANFGEAYINQHTCLVRPMPQLKNRYLPELFRSPFAQDQFNEPQRGIKNSLRLTDVTDFLVPLPPLAEQHRIVAKLDELMALCDCLDGGNARAMNLLGESLEANLVQSLAS